MISVIRADEKAAKNNRATRAFDSGCKLLEKVGKIEDINTATQQAKVSAAMKQNLYDGKTCVVCGGGLTQNVKMTEGTVGNYCQNCRTSHPCLD